MGLIFYQPMSGYDLRKAISATALKHYSASPGAIYPALQRLEAAGLIEGQIERENTLRPRKAYTLTISGLDVLKEHLSQPVSQDDVIWRLDHLMLRFSFMYELLGKEKTLKFLEEFSTATKSYIQVLENERKTLKKNVSPCGLLSFEYGLEIFQSTARWAKRTMEEIRKQGDKK
jgi:DNA-binding PadR family transcriptional regulator